MAMPSTTPLGTIYHELAPLTGFIAPPTILYVCCLPQPLYQHHPTPVSLVYAVIDVTIPSPPFYQDDALFTAISATCPHYLAEWKKFHSGFTFANSSIF
jgi:hypothetical protein